MVIGYDNLPKNHEVVLDLPMFEGIGGLVHDVSKYHNNGTIIGATWNRQPSDRWALSFDGNDYIDLGTDDSLKPTDFLTMAALYKATVPFPGPEPGAIISITGLYPALQVLSISATWLSVAFLISRWDGTCMGGGFSLTLPAIMIPGGNPLNRWLSLIGIRVVATGEVSLYIEGFKISDITFPGQPLCYDATYPNVNIGRRPRDYHGLFFYLTGLVAFPVVSARAWTPAEITNFSKLKNLL